MENGGRYGEWKWRSYQGSIGELADFGGVVERTAAGLSSLHLLLCGRLSFVLLKLETLFVDQRVRLQGEHRRVDAHVL